MQIFKYCLKLHGIIDHPFLNFVFAGEEFSKKFQYS